MVNELENPRHERFCQEYLVDLNASKAAMRAGYSVRSARQQSSRMMTNANILERIRELREERAERTGVYSDEVLQEIARVAFSDIREILNDDGTIKPLSEWPEWAAANIAGIESSTTACRENDEVIETQLRKVRRWDKVKALEMLGRHFGLFEKDNEQNQQPIVLDVRFS